MDYKLRTIYSNPDIDAKLVEISNRSKVSISRLYQEAIKKAVKRIEELNYDVNEYVKEK